MLIQDLNHIATVQENVRGGSVSAYSYSDGLVIGYGSVSAYTDSSAYRSYYSRSAYSSAGASAYGHGVIGVSAGSGAYA